VNLLITFTFTFYQKHPHVIFEARDKAKRGCANDLRSDRKNKYTNGFTGGRFRKKRRLKRDVREVTKYIETALVLDKAMVNYIMIMF